MSATEREEISRELKAGCSMREIARHLRRAPSSVSREVRRHGGIGFYRAFNADERAWRRARRPKRCLLAADERLRQLVTQKLLIDWSPEQISAWLKKAYPTDETMRVSHETIYRSLFVQARGVLKQELDAAWLKEAEDRLAAYHCGDLPAVDAEQVFDEPGKQT